MAGVRAHLTGVVQGVGFRPFVWRLATARGLAGWVNNAADGVHLEAYGHRSALEGFVEELTSKAPDAARVTGVHVEWTESEAPADAVGFSIVASTADEDARTLVSPDIATCPLCLAEMNDPHDRRWHYPFINCTSCGPRFTVIASLPYDRPATSMAGFAMCPECAREYADPSDRRFHAQPDACFECGPHISWRRAEQPELTLWGRDRASSDDIIERAASLLLQGGIVAVKGLGGFHLACDATNEGAVERLRRRKSRPAKPLAVMFGSLEQLLACLEADDDAQGVLCGSVRPICLLASKPSEEVPPRLRLAASVACGLPEVGAMLPYTPLQHLLLEACERPLVMTSGNVSGEPVLTDDDLAFEKLTGIADAWLGNDRPILARYDDSVVRVVEGRPMPVRRARGIAPSPVALPKPPGPREAPPVLACGPEQKATFAIVRGDEAFVSQHIGDLENAATFDAWLDGLDRYRELFGLSWDAIACDMHPEYLASKWARAESLRTGLPLVEVQHHHAHIAAVLAEHSVFDQVVGIVLDGTGYGPDGTIWGGEVLVCDQADFERAAHLATWPLPGAGAAVKRPNRCALGLLKAFDLDDGDAALRLTEAMGGEADVVRRMVERGLNCPLTSSAGRLFDAVSALLGLVGEASYDGEPACRLEACALESTEPRVAPDRYAFDVAGPGLDARKTGMPSAVLDQGRLVHAVVEDVSRGCKPCDVALWFHMGFSEGFARAAAEIAAQRGIGTVALAGGVFVNRIVFESVRRALNDHGLRVLVPHELPINDGGIAYGQAAVARARMSRPGPMQTTAASLRREESGR